MREESQQIDTARVSRAVRAVLRGGSWLVSTGPDVVTAEHVDGAWIDVTFEVHIDGGYFVKGYVADGEDPYLTDEAAGFFSMLRAVRDMARSLE